MPKTLSVYPNPFLHLDHDGYPAGVCPCDMVEHVGMTRRVWVGARIDPDQTFMLEKLTEEERRYRDARQQTRFKFEFSEPTTVLLTEYYKDRLRAHEIIPANIEAHMDAGMLRKDYLPPAEALAKAKAACLKQWAAETGSDEKPKFVDVLDSAIAALGAPPTPPGDAPPVVTPPVVLSASETPPAPPPAPVLPLPETNPNPAPPTGRKGSKGA